MSNGESKVQAVYASLRSEILLGKIPAGSAIGEKAVARRFGVSRTPVRQAFQMLEAEGQMSTADLRRRQARAIADRLGCSAPASDATAETLEAFFMEDPEENLKKGSVADKAGEGADAGGQASGFVLNGSLTQSEMDRFKF